MNSIVTLMHRIVINARAEEFFVKLRRNSNVVRRFIPIGIRHKFTSVGKFIPSSSSYRINDVYSLTRDNTNFKINRSDYVQWRLFYGVRDNALLAAKKYLEPNSIVLDIGANFGAFSLRLATNVIEQQYSNVHVHSFEPNPIVIENFNANLNLNEGLANIVHLHPFGLGDKTMSRSFKYIDANTGAGRIVDSTDANLRVPVQRLDDFVMELNPRKIAFIKLIAAGFEPQVLEGGWATINKFKPPIFLEVTKKWWSENNFDVNDIIAKLRSVGYRFVIEHYNEMIPFDQGRFSDKSQYNLLAFVK